MTRFAMVVALVEGLVLDLKTTNVFQSEGRIYLYCLPNAHDSWSCALFRIFDPISYPCGRQMHMQVSVSGLCLDQYHYYIAGEQSEPLNSNDNTLVFGDRDAYNLKLMQACLSLLDILSHTNRTNFSPYQ